jgi:glyoxylase-like metal-dependent hydrolase (beta-lactamase superfamily II)
VAEPADGGAVQRVDGHEVVRVRAGNPSPLTLEGTNSWVVGRDPAWVIDPGPLLDDHLDAIERAIAERGGLGGIALTHAHRDHGEAVAALRERHPAPLAAAAPPAARSARGGAEADGEAAVALADGVRFGPLEAVATPGHAPDHFAFVGHGACFTGDAVLGSGSVFVGPHPGAMSGYLRALARLSMRDDFDVICPGHGPLVTDPHARLQEYIAHRLEREHRLIAALGEGRRSVDELLDAVWFDVPAQLRPAAAITLAAHLDKLEEEDILPRGVERPGVADVQW